MVQKQAREQSESPDPVVRQVMRRRLSTTAEGLHNTSLEQTDGGGGPNVTDGWAREMRRRTSSNPQEALERQFASMQHDNLPSSPLGPLLNASVSSLQDSFSDGSSLVSPLRHRSGMEEVTANVHDGNVQQQELENTENVIVGDRMELIMPKEKKRPGISSLSSNGDVPPPPPPLSTGLSLFKRSPQRVIALPQSPPRSPRQLLLLRVSLYIDEMVCVCNHYYSALM